MARNKKVEMLSNDQEVLHPMTDGDCVIFADGQTLTQKLSEDDLVKYTPEIVNSSPMFKVGEGNSVDYSANVLDGAYERATLQGQTYVNYIQESSADEITLPTPFTEYERTQHNTLTSDEEGTLGINLVGQSYVNALQHDSEEEYVVLGESLEFQEKKVEYTSEGQIKSAMLKGQTLVNLSPEKKKTITSTTDSYEWQNTQIDLTDYVQSGKTYLIKIGSYSSSSANFSTTPNEVIFKTMDSGEQGKWFKDQIIYTVPSEFNPTLDTNSKILLRIHACIGTAIDNTVIADEIMVIEYQEGMENWDIPYFEGMQSVTVSTKLENLCQYCDIADAKTGKTFTVVDASSRALSLCSVTQTPTLFKCNTKYLVQFKISNLVLDGLESVRLIFSNGVISSGNCLFGNTTHYPILANGVYSTILTSTDLIDTSTFIIKGVAEEWEDSGSTLRSLTISNIMCIEYQNGMENWDLPYFEDYQVMKPVQVESVNKNLFDGQLESGNIDTATGNNTNYTTSADRQRTVNFIPIKPNTTYAISNNYEATFGIREYNKNKEYIGWYTKTTNANTLTETFTTTNDDVSFLKFVIVNTNTDNQIQIEESPTATEYVPHQSKTTYSWDEVILRKVGDVEDTLDLTTGEWVQRIGEITYDGSSDEAWDRMNSVAEIPSGSIIFRIKQEDMAAGKKHEKVCNTILGALPTVIYDTLYYEGIDYDCMTTVYSVGFSSNAFYLSYKNINTMEEFRKHLQANPVKVQYVLTKPIVHKVNLSRPNLQVYDDITHVHTKCLDGTLIPNIYLPSDISYPAILEPSKKYNVCVNQTEISEDNPLTVNVGGTSLELTDSRMTITTPDTLTTYTVSFTGKDNKIKESMLIKNSSLLTGDLPHFNGIGSVQLGKTIENLCESTTGYVGNATINEYKDKIVGVVTAAGPLVCTFKLTKQLENGKRYFVYAPNTFPDNYLATVGFYEKYDGKLLFARNATNHSVKKSCIITVNQRYNPYISLTIGFHDSLPTNTTIELKRPIICEYEPGMENWNWESIGYFTGTKNIGNEFMRVQNKNLFDMKKVAKDLNSIQETITENSDTSWTIVSTNLYSHSEYVYKPITFKENTRYTISMDFATSDTTKHGTVLQFNYTDGSKQYIYPYKKTTISDGNKTIKNITFTYGHKNITETISNIQIEESSTATTYAAHKHNGLYITKDQPIELTWEQGNVNAGANTSWNDAIQNTVSKRIRTKLITLKPNTSYRVSLGNKNYMWYMYAFDGNNVCPHPHSFNMKPDGFMQTDFIFTTTQQLYKIALVGRKTDDTNITPSEINHIRLEEVTDVVLRGIGNVHDELDITRGIYTQRIGEIVFDGSEDWEIYYSDGTNPDAYTNSYRTFFIIPRENVGIPANCQLYSDKYKTYTQSPDDTTEKGFIYAGVGNLNIVESANMTVDEFRNKISLNPITVQYILETPIVHKVHIGNKNESNNEVAKPNDVFTLPTLYTEQTHIDMTNNGLMPKVQSRDYIAYPISPMINRTYTLFHNNVGSNDLTVDLLGRTQILPYSTHKGLVYTPTTMDEILHNELRISGANNKISHVMYMDGQFMDREIPYIEGMKNAVNPIVKNVGKNLVQKIDNIWYFYDNIINYGGAKHSCGIAPVKPYTQYIINKDSILCFYDENGKCTNSPFQYFNANSPRIAPSGSKYMLVRHNGGDNATYLDGLQVVEYGQEFDNQEYKENICYVDCGEIRLTPNMFEQGNIVYNGANTGATYDSMKEASHMRIRMKELIKIKPNTKYLLNIKGGYRVFVREFDVNKGKLNDSALSLIEFQSRAVFTTNVNAQYISLLIGKLSDTSLPLSDFNEFNLWLIEKDNMIILRSLPNGVCDEIDLETGTYIQRVGEVVFDGSENWRLNNTNSKTTCYYLTKGSNPQLLSNMKFNTESMLCNRYTQVSTMQGEWHTSNNEGIFALSSYNSIYIVSNIMSTNGANDFKQYLSENPITVQYELAEPIVKDIVIHNYPHSYEGGHVIIENGDPNTPIPAQIKYRAVTNRSGQIQQHTEQVEKQDREINELEMLILGNIHLSQTR